MIDDKDPKEDEVDEDLEDEDAVEDDDDLEDEDAVEDDDDLDDEDDDEEDEEEDEEDEGGDLGERVLCIDGACIGVVGPDGRCKVCGTENPDYEPPSPVADTSAGGEDEVDASDSDEDEEEDDDEGEEASGAGSDDPLDFDNRVLCSDGACVGIIGSDGRCRECGKPLSDDDD